MKDERSWIIDVYLLISDGIKNKRDFKSGEKKDEDPVKAITSFMTENHINNYEIIKVEACDKSKK